MKSALIYVAAQWKDTGVGLRIYLGKFEGKPDECLNQVITKWLNCNYDIKRLGVRSWQKIVEVVCDPAGGTNKALAKKIAGFYSSMTCALYIVPVH